MALIRSAKEIAQKWQKVTPGRASIYKAHVESPLRDWEAGALASKEAYEEGVRLAVDQDRRSRGIRMAGTEKWQRKAATLGVRRWPEGVSAAGPDYERGFSPFRDVIERTDLPPRYPAGDERNYDRSKVIGTALHELKISG